MNQDQSIGRTLGSISPGDTIQLNGSLYNEKVIIDISATLISTSNARLVGDYTGSTLLITAPNVVVNGIHVAASGTNLSKDDAGIMIQADSVTIKNCSITEMLHGIYVKAGNQTLIENNRIEGRLDLVEADRGNGIHLWNSKNNRIIQNEILNVRDGIYFSFADSTEITKNLIHQVRYGLHYMYSNNNRFIDNHFTRNVAGAALMYSHNILFQRNVFARCRGFRAYGILYQSMDSTYAESNLILDNSRGIFLNNSSNNILKGNDVVDNDLAIQLNGGCEENSFLGNNFINNLSDLILDVSDYNTVWEDESGGNYWSSYRGYDLGGDGKGDVSHNIQNVFQVMETRVPEVRFYLLSPAAEILETAERALPILSQDNAVDTQPYINKLGQLGVPWDGIVGYSNKFNIAVVKLYILIALLPAILFLVFSRRIGGRV